jgi:putative transposase
MQQSLDRRQPPARFRPQSREIPLQRRRGTAGNGDDNRHRTSRDDRSGPVTQSVTAPRELPPRARDERRTGDRLRAGGVPVEVGNAPVAATGLPIHAEIAATAGLEGFGKHGPDVVDQRPTAAVVSREVEPAATPAAEPLDGLGKPEEIPELLRTSQEGTSVAGDLSSGDLPMISDQAWQWMEPLLPPSTGRRGRRWRDHRQVVEAISWKYRTGSTWRELPARFGPWQTAYGRLTRWAADGTWANLLAQARTDAAGLGELDWLAAVDSTLVRVHQHEMTARRVDGTAALALPDDAEDGAAA